MAFLTTVSINWQISPRLITVAEPVTSIVLQDLHDTLVRLQDDIEGAQFPNIVDSAGKESLGGTELVAITMTLLDAQLSFAARNNTIEDGTVTTPGVTTLIDSTALFQTAGVVRGDLVLNDTDGSHASVLEVVSETQLETTVLGGGVDNDYDAADAYKIFDVARCEITGGNLVAVDAVGADLDATLQTFGTQINYRASSSGTLVLSGSGVTAQDKVDIADEVATRVYEGTMTFEQMQRIMLAAMAGLSTGNGTAFRDLADTKDRITGTVVGKDRTAVTLDGT